MVNREEEGKGLSARRLEFVQILLVKAINTSVPYGGGVVLEINDNRITGVCTLLFSLEVGGKAKNAYERRYNAPNTTIEGVNHRSAAKGRLRLTL